MNRAYKVYNTVFGPPAPNIGNKIRFNPDVNELNGKFIYGFCGFQYTDIGRGIGEVYKGASTNITQLNFMVHLFGKNNKYIFKGIPYGGLIGFFVNTYDDASEFIVELPLGRVPYAPVNNFVDFNNSYFQTVAETIVNQPETFVYAIIYEP